MRLGGEVVGCARSFSCQMQPQLNKFELRKLLIDFGFYKQYPW